MTIVDILESTYGVIQSFVTTTLDLINSISTFLIAMFFAIYQIFKWVVAKFAVIGAKVAAGSSLYGSMQSTVSSAIYNALPSGLGNAFAFVNYGFPLTELIALTAVLMALFVIAASLRFIKSFIPTIA